MLRVLNIEESFDILNQRFAELSEFDVIDLWNDGSRHPAMVVSVDKKQRTFNVLPLDKQSASGIMTGQMPQVRTVVLPNAPGERDVQWNRYG